jgi:hypothetical protein
MIAIVRVSTANGRKDYGIAVDVELWYKIENPGKSYDIIPCLVQTPSNGRVHAFEHDHQNKKRNKEEESTHQYTNKT